MNCKEIIVKYLIILFSLICILTIILLTAYYFTPNNYLILKNDNEMYKYISNESIEINSNSFIILTDSKYKNVYLKFSNDDEINLIIYNWFKSQNIIINPTDLLYLNSNSNSNIKILNNSENKIILNLQFYSSK